MSTETECSLWQAFDAMQLCYTVIPQVKNYYRYGEFKDCSLARQQFNFCLSTKTKSSAEAAILISQNKNIHQHKKTFERSSGTVWEIRTSPPENFPPS